MIHYNCKMFIGFALVNILRQHDDSWERGIPQELDVLQRYIQSQFTSRTNKVNFWLHFTSIKCIYSYGKEYGGIDTASTYVWYVPVVQDNVRARSMFRDILYIILI